GRLSGSAGRGRIPLRETVARSPDSPLLYDLQVKLFDGPRREADRGTPYFGVCTDETRDGRRRPDGEAYGQPLVLDQGCFPGGPRHRSDRRRPAWRHRPRQGTRIQRSPQAPEGRGSALAVLGGCLGLPGLGRDAERPPLFARGGGPARGRVEGGRAA